MGRVIHFEITAVDPERAANFYRKVFGWEIMRWAGNEDYWLVSTGPIEEPGINGGIMMRTAGAVKETNVDIKSPSQAINFINTIDVKNLGNITILVEENGGEVVRAREEVPGIGYLAYCKDSEGNMFGVMEANESA